MDYIEELKLHENGNIKNESTIATKHFSIDLEQKKVLMYQDNTKNDRRNEHSSKMLCVQYGITVIVTMSAFAVGMQYGWIGPTLRKLMLKETNIEMDGIIKTSWFASSLKLGGILGPFLASYLADYYGRKTCILMASLPLLIAWLIISFANKMYQLVLAEFISGIATQSILTVLPIYIGETASPKIRGTLAIFIPLQFYMGFLLENIIVPRISVTLNSVIAVLVILLLLSTCFWMPESPYYFLMKNNSEKAEISLRILTQNNYVEAKLERIKYAIDVQREAKIGIFKLFKDPVNLLSFWIVLGVTSIHQFCGFMVVLLYAQVILQIADTPIDANIGGSILCSVGIVVLLVSIASVDNWGRRPLLIISSIITAISLLVIGLYFHLKASHYEYISYLKIVPLVALILFKCSYGMGIGPLYYVYASEMFNTNFKSSAVCLLNSYMSLTNFIILKLFHIVNDMHGEYYPFYFFAFCSLCGAVFSYFILPETKGKTLEEIQILLKRKLT